MSLYPFDITLALILVVLAWRILVAPDLFQSVVLFIVFGLLMAIAWSRLQAFDIALAEAAIGAGLTGALLLNTLARLEGTPATQREFRGNAAEPETQSVRSARPSVGKSAYSQAEEPRSSSVDHGKWSWIGNLGWKRWGELGLLGLLAGVFVLLLGRCLLEIAPAAVGLREEVLAHMPKSGVSHPITAVLLNFRAYDTLLEMGVLLVAVVAAWSLGPISTDDPARSPPGPVLVALVRIFSPLMLLVACYILWAGTGQPGGAFQAGAVLSAAGVLLVVSGALAPPTLRPFSQRLLLLIGLLVFLLISIGPMMVGNQFLEYPAPLTGSLILLLETTLMMSIALTLLCLFVGGQPRSPSSPRDKTDAPH